MDRRKAMKIFAGVVVGSGAGMYALSKALKPDYQQIEVPERLPYIKTGSNGWEYDQLDPSKTAELAYKLYPEGSCMYAVFKGVLSQLADKFGEPYASFPFHMMRYGSSGIGGFGTICGSLNGATALIGLLVTDKPAQDVLITGLCRWYEKIGLPEFKPQVPIFDYTPPPSVSNSTLCHVSISNWVNKSGQKATGDKRVERCRRLTGDVAYRVTVILNEYFNNTYVTVGHDNQTVGECMTCHGDRGKLNDTFGKMDCSSCHTESIGHRLFANPHYKLKRVE